MHAAIQLAAFWAFAFVTLCAAVVLLSIFGGVIESDMELLNLGKEAVVAGIASLIEALGVWLVVVLVEPEYRATGARVLFIPVLIVALLYKVAHLESWSIYEVGLLLAFQIAIGSVIASLIAGHFQMAIMIVVVFGILLAAIAAFTRSLGG